jgi:uncharacterized protein
VASSCLLRSAPRAQAQAAKARSSPLHYTVRVSEVSMSGQQAIQIEQREEDGRGGFFVEREGIRLAEMTYARVNEKLVIIDHTLVDDRLRGLGVARRLLDSAVAWARSTGTKLAATCPYAKAQFEKDPSIQDVYDR